MRLLVLLLLTSIAMAGPDALALLKQADERLVAFDLPGAEQALSEALRASPRIKDAYLARAHLRLKLTPPNAAGAARDFERGARLGGGTWRAAAMLYGRLFEYDRQAHAYEQAWKAGAGLGDLHGVAAARANAGDLEAALFAYNELIRRGEPKPSIDHLGERAEIRAMLGSSEAGLRDIERGLALNAGWFRGHQIRGRIQMRMGRPKDALASYKKALEMEPRIASSYFILGLAHYDIGNWNDAVWGFQRTLSFGDGSAHPYAMLYMFMARCRTGVAARRVEAYRELMKQVSERKQGTDDWFGKLAGHLAGLVGAEELLEEAHKANRFLRRDRLCEAHAYIGARLLISEEPEAARGHFKKAVATGVYTFMEYKTSWCELERLK